MSDFLLAFFNITIFDLSLNPLLFLIVFIMCLLEILIGGVEFVSKVLYMKKYWIVQK